MLFLFLLGPGSRASAASRLAHVTCFIWGDLRDKSTYWLSNRIPAVDLHSLIFYPPPVPSLCLSVSLPLSLSPSLWRASRLSYAVSEELEFKRRSLQQHMKHCYLEPSRSETLQSSLSPRWFPPQWWFVSGHCSLCVLCITGGSNCTRCGFRFFTEVSSANPVCAVEGSISVYLLSQSCRNWNWRNEAALQSLCRGSCLHDCVLWCVTAIKEVTGAGQSVGEERPVLDPGCSRGQVCLCSGRALQGCLAPRPPQMISFCRGQRAPLHAVATSRSRLQSRCLVICLCVCVCVCVCARLRKCTCACAWLWQCCVSA